MTSRSERPSAPRVATGFVAGWTLMLVALAALWVRSPFLGIPAAFLAWSAPAFAMTLATWRWLRRLSLRQIQVGRRSIVVLTCVWAAALLVAVSEAGPTLALDGLVMRRDAVRIAGRALTWSPLLFGISLSVAGLAAGLEARYRIVNGPGTPSTPTDPGR